jgi:hypothetical protein
MKGNELSFPFIYFSESGLFNELRPIQIKKFSSLFSCALSVGITGGQGSGDLRKLARILFFVNEMSLGAFYRQLVCSWPSRGAESVI